MPYKDKLLLFPPNTSKTIPHFLSWVFDPPLLAVPTLMPSASSAIPTRTFHFSTQTNSSEQDVLGTANKGRIVTLSQKFHARCQEQPCAQQ